MSDFEIEEALFAQIRSQQLKVAMIATLALAWTSMLLMSLA
jgi:hypothetical protein